MRYLSLFSGIGGLESASSAPVLCCESDSRCIGVLRRRLGSFEVYPDVVTLTPPSADVVCGGWPCQDLSVAGRRLGLAGPRSGLFFQLLRVAKESGAHTIVAENVPNLLKMEKQATFRHVLEALTSADQGYTTVAWRTLNAREFGLPHQRERVFIVASKHDELAMSLHRRLVSPTMPSTRGMNTAGFYWTAGLQSLCYSLGYSPTLKVGSSLSIPSPPAVHFGDCVRKLTAKECILLQGFSPPDFAELRDQEIYRMMGNAVAAPVGHFVMESVESGSPPDDLETAHFAIGPSGYYSSGELVTVRHRDSRLAINLCDFIDLENQLPLSSRAAAGLALRLKTSGKPCPADLMQLLLSIAGPSLKSAKPTDLDEETDVLVEDPESADIEDLRIAQQQMSLWFDPGERKTLTG